MRSIIFVLFFVCLNFSVNAQQKGLILDGNILFDDDANYLYQLQVNCKTKDTFVGKVVYTPKAYMTIQQRLRSRFQQAITLSISEPLKKIYLIEGNAIGSSSKNNVGSICYMQGELDYVILNEATFCYGKIIGFDDSGDSCSAGFLFLSSNNNIENYCTKPEEPNKKSIEAKDYQMAIATLFSKKETQVNVIDSTTLQITAIPVTLLPNTASTLYHTGDSLTIAISDYDTEDDDLISVTINGKIFLRNYVLKKEPIELKFLATNAIDTIVIESHNHGLFAPNSALLMIGDGVKIYPFATASKPKDKMILHCIRKR